MEATLVRNKATFELKKPIPSGLHMPVSEIEYQWVLFLYKKLPLVCYRCGIIGHQQKKYNMIFNEFDSLEAQEQGEGYFNKIKMNPKALENCNILLLAFLNSTKYTRYVQFTKLMI